MSKPQGDRTEKPTPKRIKDAREKGQVARSRDLSAAASFAAASLALGWFGVHALQVISDRFVAAFESVATRGQSVIDAPTVATLMLSDAWLVTLVVGPTALAAAVFSVATSVAQTGWVVAPKAVEFNWGRLNPSNGFSKFSPKQAGGELVKALLGLGVLGAFCYYLVRQVFEAAPSLVAMMPGESAAVGWHHVIGLLWRAGVVLALLAIGDYGLQWWRWHSQLKMTRQEVRDESKSQDGNPEIKMRVRRIQREMTKKRMLQDVKTATVVITNPTHVAVALRYDRAAMSAPLVVAKGQDHMALRIRQVAREHDVPIVENVTLARALHRGAEVGESIPSDLFGAVAEILAYLVRLKQLIL